MDGIELGAIDFLAKPVNPHYVRERVLNTVAAVWNEAPPEQSKKDSSVEANSEKPTHLPPLFEEETPYALSSSGPIGSTGPFFLLPEDIESISSGWIKRLVMLCQYRPSLSLGQVWNIQELTALLAKQYVMDHPNGALTEVDAKMIGVAATFYDIGLIGIPDDILRGGIHQPRSRNLFKACRHWTRDLPEFRDETPIFALLCGYRLLAPQKLRWYWLSTHRYLCRNSHLCPTGTNCTAYYISYAVIHEPHRPLPAGPACHYL